MEEYVDIPQPNIIADILKGYRVPFDVREMRELQVTVNVLLWRRRKGKGKGKGGEDGY